MPNSIGPTGLTLATRDEIITYWTAQFQAIYGADIVLSSDSPDGQLLNDFAQAVLDLQDLLQQVYNMMDPDSAVGVILDQRVAINGIQRQAGTFTVQPVTIGTNQPVNLYGLDQTDQPVYTVSDNNGNQWQLQATQLGFNPGSGGSPLNFQAANPGAIQSAIGAITVPVTIVLGVTSINNPSGPTTVGINEESDAQLKVRRQKSVSLASQGYLAGLLAALENITGVTSAFVYENTTATTDGNGVPGHSIWVIVSGTGAAADIAEAIYTKRNAGCGMFGATTFVVTQADGSSFVVSWDTVVPEPIFITFYASSLNGTTPPNIAAILDTSTGLPAIFAPGVAAEVNINQLATLVQKIDPNCLVQFSGSGTPSTGGFSTSSGGSYTPTLTPSTKNRQFAVTKPNIIVLPMILSPTTVIVPASATQTFTGLGGFGTLTYSIFVNNSGGSINSSTGVYTAGPTTGVTDTIKVIDSIGNTATALAAVT